MAYAIKQYGFLMYKYSNKIVCLSRSVKVTESNKKLPDYKICLFSVHYKSIMFYSTCPWCYSSISYWKLMLSVENSNPIIQSIQKSFLVKIFWMTVIYYNRKNIVMAIVSSEVQWWSTDNFFKNTFQIMSPFFNIL